MNPVRIQSNSAFFSGYYFIGFLRKFMSSHYVRLLSSLQLDRVLTKAAVVAQVNVKHLVQLLQSYNILTSENKL